jgi:hypothetical protein
MRSVQSQPLSAEFDIVIEQMLRNCLRSQVEVIQPQQRMMCVLSGGRSWILFWIMRGAFIITVGGLEALGVVHVVFGAVWHCRVLLSTVWYCMVVGYELVGCSGRGSRCGTGVASRHAHGNRPTGFYGPVGCSERAPGVQPQCAAGAAAMRRSSAR